MKKIGFVCSWYGDNIPGGAETELRGIVKHLNAKGIALEVLTTCIKQFDSDWNENFYPEGESLVDGIIVKRFAVRKRNVKKFDAINQKLMNKISITTEEEKVFIEEMANSPSLYSYIKIHSEEYSSFVYIPYMFGTTYFGICACPDKAVVIPCFHEESYIHMHIFKEVFEMAKGFIYLSKPEYQLANSIFEFSPSVKQLILGAGVDTGYNSDAERFKRKFGINAPFILYAGRKDSGKNINLLISYFAMFKKLNPLNPLKLVLIGGGKVELPINIVNDVIDLGFVDIQDKHDANAASLVVCQPSIHESFSIVIMEGWLAKRPVLVHEECAVTKNFVCETNGGLYFKTYYEFQECVLYLMNHNIEATIMGNNGRKYVLSHFSWNVITDKLIKYFAEMEDE